MFRNCETDNKLKDPKTCKNIYINVPMTLLQNRKLIYMYMYCELLE